MFTFFQFYCVIALSNIAFYRYLTDFVGEGNGNPLQCSCLENPRDRGGWWATIYGVAQGRTRLKWLSSSSRALVWLFSNVFHCYFPDDHLGSFSFSTSTNNAAANILVHKVSIPTKVYCWKRNTCACTFDTSRILHWPASKSLLLAILEPLQGPCTWAP